MADTKISELTSLAAATATDLIPIVDDIGGTPTTKQIAFSALNTSLDHDALTNFVANEHLDWTSDLGATNIHSGNIPDLSATYATAAKGVTNGDSHDHSGGDGAAITWANVDKTTSSIADITTKSHTALSDIGTNTHAQIDTHIADASDPHGSTLTQTTITAGTVTITTDQDTDDTVYVPQVLHGTDATPPAANTVTRGTIYIQYTA